MSTLSAPVAHGVRPRQPAPDLTVPLLSGGTYRLADQHPDGYTMLVFFRGLHCPVCRAQLSELNRRLDDLREQGIEVVAVSGETRERTEQLASEWKLDRLPLAYGLTQDQMRNWGLFVSHGIGDHEPAVFNEPRSVPDRVGRHRLLRVDPLDAGGPAATRRPPRRPEVVAGAQLPGPR